MGRLIPNFFADRVGPYNILIPCLTASSVLLFALFGIKTFAGVVVYGLLYGATSGACEPNLIHTSLAYCEADSNFTDFSLIPSLVAQLSRHLGEQG